MGSDGHNDDVADLRRKDGASGSEGVGGGTGGCGGDDAISDITCHWVAIDFSGETDRADILPAADNDLIDDLPLAELFLVTPMFRAQHQALFQAVIPVEEAGKVLPPLIGLQFNQESHSAEVDADNGNSGRGTEVGGAQHGTIASEDNERVGFARVHAGQENIIIDLTDAEDLHIMLLQKTADLASDSVRIRDLAVISNRKTLQFLLFIHTLIIRKARML